MCSYFLISFWFEKPANASAGKKAFVTNRVGDWGFMVAMFLTWFTLRDDPATRQFLPLSPGRSATTTATAICAACCSSAPSASRPSSRCTCGCPTPWPARRRCRP